jgi:hypothetical protein
MERESPEAELNVSIYRKRNGGGGRATMDYGFSLHIEELRDDGNQDYDYSTICLDQSNSVF